MEKTPQNSIICYAYGPSTREHEKINDQPRITQLQPPGISKVHDVTEAVCFAGLNNYYLVSIHYGMLLQTLIKPFEHCRLERFIDYPSLDKYDQVKSR